MRFRLACRVGISMAMATVSMAAMASAPREAEPGTPTQSQPSAQWQLQSQTEWFTVAGNPADPAANTVQVDPVAIGVEPDSRPVSRRMNLRVNRSAERVNWDNISYRSYESQVVFDCKAQRAAYVQARYYAQPLWQGEPHTVADYGGNPRPMLFRDMEPNPVSRIVRAACRLKAG